MFTRAEVFMKIAPTKTDNGSLTTLLAPPEPLSSDELNMHCFAFLPYKILRDLN